MNVEKNVLKNARTDRKQIEGTPCFVIKNLWAIAQETPRNGVRTAFALAGYKDKQSVIDDADKICAFGNVGETRVNGSIIKFSGDLLLRYLSAKHKELVKMHNQLAHKVEDEERAKRKAEKQAEKERKQAEKAKAKADAEKRHADKEKVRKAREAEEKASKAA